MQSVIINTNYAKFEIMQDENGTEFENMSYEELEKLIIEELKESAFMWQIKRLLLLDINNCWK